jgi:hypothetical protein
MRIKSYEAKCYMHDLDMLIISHYLKVFPNSSFMVPNYDFHMDFEWVLSKFCAKFQEIIIV